MPRLFSVSPGGSGGSSTFAGLSDVAISSPVVGQVPRYDGSVWRNVSTLSGLTGIHETTISGGWGFTGDPDTYWGYSAANTLTAVAGGTAALRVFSNGTVESSSGLFQSLESEVSLKYNGGSTTAFRSTRAGSWLDSQTTTFFQIGSFADYAQITGASGGVLSRFGITAANITLTGVSYNTQIVPVGYLTITPTDTVQAVQVNRLAALATGDLWRGENNAGTALTRITSAGFHSIPLGTVSTPSLYIESDPNTGAYSSAADSLDFTAGGTRRIQINGIGIGLNNVTPVARPDITGSRAVTEQALKDLLTKLASTGLITDSTTT